MGLGCGFRVTVRRGASRVGGTAFRHEGGGGGGALWWALLPPGLGSLGVEVVEDILGGLGSRCHRGAGLDLGLGFGSRLGQRCGDGFGWLLCGGFGFLPGCGRGLH